MPVISPQIANMKDWRNKFINMVADLLPQGNLPNPPLGMQVTDPGTWQGAGQRVLDMAIPQPEDTMMGLMNPWYHGTHRELIDIIKKGGFKPSKEGTAGPGIYFADSPKNALYERNPTLSESVKQFGKQPDSYLKVDINGPLYDAGLFGREGGPSVYLKPHQWAANELYGESLPFSEIFNNAPELLRKKGYTGIKWEWPDNRKSAVVYNPNDIIISK